MNIFLYTYIHRNFSDNLGQCTLDFTCCIQRAGHKSCLGGTLALLPSQSLTVSGSKHNFISDMLYCVKVDQLTRDADKARYLLDVAHRSHDHLQPITCYVWLPATANK